MAKRCGCDSADGGVGLTVTSVPLTGSTLAIGANESLHYLDHPATIAALTITLPNYPTMLADEVTIISRSIVTALTVSDEAGGPVLTVSGAPTALTAGQYFRMRLVDSVWRRVG